MLRARVESCHMDDVEKEKCFGHNLSRKGKKDFAM
jgi:hypothetical protein